MESKSGDGRPGLADIDKTEYLGPQDKFFENVKERTITKEITIGLYRRAVHLEQFGQAFRIAVAVVNRASDELAGIYDQDPEFWEDLEREALSKNAHLTPNGTNGHHRT